MLTKSTILLTISIQNLLRTSSRMNGGEKTLHDTKVLMKDFQHRGHAVSGAACVGDNSVLGSGMIQVRVNAIDKGRRVRGGSRDEDSFCLSVGNVIHSEALLCELARAFEDVIDA